MDANAFGDVPSAVVAWVGELHRVVSEVAAPIAARNAARLQCREGCADCCVDGLTVFIIEAARIAQTHGALLTTGSPHPTGACAFLDERGSCRIYDERPYVCRTQGLPLRWLDVAPDDEGEGSDTAPVALEMRDICPKNDENGPPLEDLPADGLFTLGPFEERLSSMQAKLDGGQGRRVALRDLFHSKARASAKLHLPIVREDG